VSRVTSNELPGTVPARTIEARGLGSGVCRTCCREESAKFCDESGWVKAASGTTMTGELFEARPTWLAIAAPEAGSMMAPLIKATAGSAEHILRNGNLIVCTRLPSDMTLQRQTLGFDRYL
jgi:hypothetical protein